MKPNTPSKHSCFTVSRSVTPPLSPSTSISSVLGHQLLVLHDDHHHHEDEEGQQQHPTTPKNKNIRWWEPPEEALLLENSSTQAEAMLFEDSNTIIFPGIKVFPNEFVTDDVDSGKQQDIKTPTSPNKLMTAASAQVPTVFRGSSILQNVAIGTSGARRPDKNDLPHVCFAKSSPQERKVKKNNANKTSLVHKPAIVPRFQKVIKQTATKEAVVGVPVQKSAARRRDKRDFAPPVLANAKKPKPRPQEKRIKKRKANHKTLVHKPTILAYSRKRSKQTANKKPVAGVPVKLSLRTKHGQRSSLKSAPRLTKTDKDIIAGRGGESNNHGSGNEFFWVLILLHRPIYRQFGKDIEKKQAIASNCWKMAQMGGRRFLGRHKETKELMELPKEKSLEKCKQALRGSDTKVPKSLRDPQTCHPMPLAVLKQRFENHTKELMEVCKKKSLENNCKHALRESDEKVLKSPLKLDLQTPQAVVLKQQREDEQLVPFLKNVRVLFESLHQIGALKLVQP